MKLHEYKMSVHPGTGTVGRFPSAVVLLAGEEGGAESDKLMNLVSTSTTPAKSRDLGSRLRSHFERNKTSGISAFAAVVETDGGLSVYLHGPVEVAADSPNVEFRAWGPGDAPLLRYDAPDAVGSLAVYFSGNGNGANGNGTALDLRAGVVSGNGLVLRRAGAEEPSKPAPPAAEPTVVEPIPLPPVSAVPVSAPAAPAPASGLRPMYLSRLLTRLLVTLTLGVGVTFALGPLLRVGFAPVGVTYTTVLVSLALLLGLGLALWDPLYGLLQRTRNGNDWPAPLLLAQAVPEALLVYGLQNLVFGDLVVNQTALTVHLAVTSAVLALASYGLTFVPFARRHLFRAGSNPSSSSIVDKGGATTPSLGTSTNGNGSALVWGINCADGHFNRPDARYCGTCGTAMHGLTREPVQAPRPALGYLVSDDGTARVIDSDLVLGDSQADIHLDQWDVTISDRGTPSGTYVREPDGASLIRLMPGQPFALRPGTQIHAGRHNFTFHAHNHR